MKIFLCLWLIIPFTLLPQNAPDTTGSLLAPISYLMHDAGSVINDAQSIAIAPLSFDKKDWLNAGIVGGTVALAFLLDKPMNNIIENNKTSALDNYTKYGALYGEVQTASVITAAIYLGGRIAGSEKLSKTGRMMFESLMFSGLITVAIKTISGRGRPYSNDGTYDFDGIGEGFTKQNHVSFPSGHTTVAFAVSTVLAGEIDNPFATVALYSLAGLTAYQRMYSNSHWFSDVVLGAAIGHFIGEAVIKLNENKDENKSYQLSCYPFMDKNGSGIDVMLAF